MNAFRGGLALGLEGVAKRERRPQASRGEDWGGFVPLSVD